MIKYLIFICILLFSSISSASVIDCDKIRTDELYCLACNIYHEARGELLPGQYLVGIVTIARVRNNSYPNSICKVVWQQHQFSWTKDGKTDIIKELSSWNEILYIATVI